MIVELLSLKLEHYRNKALDYSGIDTIKKKLLRPEFKPQTSVLPKKKKKKKSYNSVTFGTL
jgi:hypothetical protein